MIVGNDEETHIGHHFKKAARELGLNVVFCDVKEATKGSVWLQRLKWRFFDRQPLYLNRFSRFVVDNCKKKQVQAILATGIAPLNYLALKEIGDLKIKRINYLTDDPFSPSQKANWFLQSLPFYDFLFTPRRANIDDLKTLKEKNIYYLPFGYEPEIHFPEAVSVVESDYSDVLFYGGADKERIPYIRALIKEGFKISLYGGYWNRYPDMRRFMKGLADAATLRRAVATSKVVLCLVRHSNRDGNSMRSFEVPAMKGCALMEDTEEHREIFGDDKSAVYYFKNQKEMVRKIRFLIENSEERRRLSENARNCIVGGAHTYKDRLLSMCNNMGIDRT
jgi:spore maturation protein CgeB